jgi:hypothetical protein
MPPASPLNAVNFPPDLDRRAEPRTDYRARAQLLRYPPARHRHVIDVTVTNYSSSGIGVSHSEGLLVGQLFVVREPNVTRGHTCLYTVTRSDQQPDGTFAIGLRAIQKLEDDWDPFTPPPAPGVTIGSKLLFLIFAIAGAATIIAAAILYK